MHQSIYFRAALIAFLVAVAVASFVIVPHPMVWIGVIAGLTCLSFAPRPGWIFAGIIILAGMLGVYRYQLARSDATPLHELALAKADVTIVGYVDSDAKQGSKDWSITVQARSVDGESVSERILVRLGYDPVEKYGNGVQISGRIGRASAFDDFDYPAYLRANGIRSIMIHPHVETAVVPLSWREQVWVKMVRGIWDIRDAFMASVRRAMPEPASSYIIGILVGGRAVLPQSIVDEFARASTSHVLAISGYNITILATAVMGVLVSHIGRRRAMIFTIIMVAVFVIMTGAGASIVRAAIMSMLVLLASGLGRQVEIGNVILLSGAAMVAVNPLILRDDVSFQLSFAALGGLVWLEPIIKAKMGKWAESTVGGITAQTMAAQIAVLPLILYYFHTLSVIGPVANVLVLPFVPLAMALGFATGIVGLVVPVVARIVAIPAWAVATYHLTVVHYLAALPWSAFDIVINSAILVAMYAIILIWWHLQKRDITKVDLRKEVTGGESEKALRGAL